MTWDTIAQYSWSPCDPGPIGLLSQYKLLLFFVYNHIAICRKKKNLHALTKQGNWFVFVIIDGISTAIIIKSLDNYYTFLYKWLLTKSLRTIANCLLTITLFFKATIVGNPLLNPCFRRLVSPYKLLTIVKK